MRYSLWVTLSSKPLVRCKDISRQGGRTVMFVSHNMAAVKSLCTRLLVSNGSVFYEGDVAEGIATYLNAER
jgi:lipopolysaccharide transport system ATP-binding protein